MYTATAGIVLPTTIIGSLPRPGWYTQNLGRREFREAMVELQLSEDIQGLVSMLSARGKPDESGYAAPIVPDELPEDAAAYADIIAKLKANEIVAGKFLSADGELALAVLALDRARVAENGAKSVIGKINEILDKSLTPVGLKSHLTGAPVTFTGNQLLQSATGGVMAAGTYFQQLAPYLVH